MSRNPTGFDFNTRMPSPMCGDGTSMQVRAGLPIVTVEFLSNILGMAACGNFNPNYGDPRNTVQPAARICAQDLQAELFQNAHRHVVDLFDLVFRHGVDGREGIADHTVRALTIQEVGGCRGPGTLASGGGFPPSYAIRHAVLRPFSYVCVATGS